MRALVWIAENTWEGCVDHARALVPADAEVVLLFVSPSDVEGLVAERGGGLLGRRRPPAPEPPVRALAAEEANALLARARDRLGRRDVSLEVRRGRVEREVVAFAAGFDLLVMARDGRLRLGPPSLGPRARFVVDHAPCQVLLVWGDEPPGIETIPPPPPPGAKPPPPPEGPPHG